MLKRLGAAVHKEKKVKTSPGVVDQRLKSLNQGRGRGGKIEKISGRKKKGD